jgi:predicted HicB family RNase H-like nuclease
VGSELHKKAVMMARISNMSLNQFVENAIKEKVALC